MMLHRVAPCLVILLAGSAAARTQVQLLDIEPGSSHSNPTEFVQTGGLVYFSAYQGATGTELWATDGTPAGTKVYADIWPSWYSSKARGFALANDQRFVSLGNLVFLGRRSTLPLPLGGSCRFYLDLTGPMVLLHTSTGTSYSASIPIPSTPTLLGARMHLQSLHPGTGFPGSSGFSNSIEWVLGK